MLKKEDFIKLMEQKEHSYSEIENPTIIHNLIDRLLEQLYAKLKEAPYRQIMGRYSVRLFEVPKNLAYEAPYSIKLHIPYEDKSREEIDKIGYWIALVLKRDYDIIGTEGTDEFCRPDLWIPTDQFMESTSKLEEDTKMKEE